jgi:hypothetical protein
VSSESHALKALAAWATNTGARLAWERVTVQGSPAFDFGLPSPYSARLVASDGSWKLMMTTAKGDSVSVLGPTTDEPAIIFDGLLYAIFVKATRELESKNREASAALSTLLRHLADETLDLRYCGRAATLLAGHAIKDGYRLQASMRLEEAVRLFDESGDRTAADTARAALANLSELMQSS